MKSVAVPKTTRSWPEFAAFVAITAGGLALAIFGVLAPLLVWALQDEDHSDRRLMLARYRAVAARENAVRDYVRQVKERNARGDLLEGASAGIVAAALQSRLKVMAEAAGVTVLSIQALPPKTLAAAGGDAAGESAAGSAQGGAPQPQLVGARMDFTGTMEAVHNLAQKIEAGPPLLVIASAVMSQTMNWGAPADGQPPLLQAQLDVYGGAPTGGRP
jgi:hypothetical protein